MIDAFLNKLCKEQKSSSLHPACSATLWTAIVKCRVCGEELNRATGVPEHEKTRIAVSATLMCLCDNRSHNTGSDYNLNFDMEWLPEPPND